MRTICDGPGARPPGASPGDGSVGAIGVGCAFIALGAPGLGGRGDGGLAAGPDELVRVAASAPEELVDAPGELMQYMLDHMLAGHEQDDDVTMLVMHVPLDVGAPDVAVTGHTWMTR